MRRSDVLGPGALLGLLLLSPPTKAAEPLPSDAATRLLLHFDDSLQGANGQSPVESSGVAFASGVIRGGAHVAGGLTYPSPPGESSAGTIELWVNPDWNGSDRSPQRTLVQIGDAVWLGIDRQQNLRLTLRGDDLGTPAVEQAAVASTAADISSWHSGGWYHLAATWDRAGALALYVNGRAPDRSRANRRVALAQNAAAALRIGRAPADESSIDATLDELRLSDRARGAAEIAQDVVAAFTVTALQMALDPALPGGTLYESWLTSPRLTAQTPNLGARALPPLAAVWSSSDSAVASVDPRGRVTGLRAGSATIAATLAGFTASSPVSVRAAARAPSHDRFDSFLASPAAGALYEIPVVILRLLPTQDGENIDTAETGGPPTRVEDRKQALDESAVYTKFMLEEGSRFRAYKDSSAQPSIGYRVLDVISIYEPAPPGFRMASPVYDALRATLTTFGADAFRGKSRPDDGEITLDLFRGDLERLKELHGEAALPALPRQPLAGAPEVYFPDYQQILARFGGQEWVEKRGVKEFWLYTYHTERVAPDESNMSSPTTGDISNSFRFEDDLPLYDRTYTLFGYNELRTPTDNVHDHGHQLEYTLAYVDELQHGNDDLFWRSFVGRDAAGTFVPGRCGDVHHPPNAREDYDFNNTALVLSDIENWTPFGGLRKPINRDSWATFAHAWPHGPPPWLSAEPQWFQFWMQSHPGRGNTIPAPLGRMQNWWVFKADWDAAIAAGLGLEGPVCGYALGAASAAVQSLGGARTVALQTEAACAWTATSNAVWLTLDAASHGGSGNGTVAFRAAPNRSVNPRSATVVIGGEVLTVTQEGARGDADGDGLIDVLDVFYLINYLFSHGPPPSFRADANGDGAIDVLDVFTLVNVLFGPQE